MEMGAAWACQKDIIPIVVPPVKLDVLKNTPLGGAQTYSLTQPTIGTILYHKLIASHVIQRLSTIAEEEFTAGLSEFANRIEQCMLDMSRINQFERMLYKPVASNGNDQSIQLKQAQDCIEMAVDFSPNPMYKTCEFVSSVVEFNPPLNWKAFINTEAYLKFRLESPDHSVHAISVEIKATEKQTKCFDNTYSLADGKHHAMIKIRNMMYQNLLDEITQICIVARPNQVPAYKGKLIFEFMGLFFD